MSGKIMRVETVMTKYSLVLANLKDFIESDNTFYFTSKSVKFVIDNCAVSHICSNLELFFNMKSIGNVGVMVSSEDY